MYILRFKFDSMFIVFVLWGGGWWFMPLCRCAGRVGVIKWWLETGKVLLPRTNPTCRYDEQQSHTRTPAAYHHALSMRSSLAGRRCLRVRIQTETVSQVVLHRAVHVLHHVVQLVALVCVRLRKRKAHIVTIYRQSIHDHPAHSPDTGKWCRPRSRRAPSACRADTAPSCRPARAWGRTNTRVCVGHVALRPPPRSPCSSRWESRERVPWTLNLWCANRIVFFVIRCRCDLNAFGTLTVVQPIGNWWNGDTALEHILLCAQQHRCYVATVAPAPDADACLVQEVQRVQEISISIANTRHTISQIRLRG